VVKQIGSDNEKEFTSGPLLEFSQRNEIFCHASCVDTPQQNGVVERKHTHLLEVARALRLEGGLPKRF